MMSERTRGLLYAIILALVCVGVPVWNLSQPTERERMSAVAPDAQIVDVEENEHDDAPTTYTPTMGFEDSDHRSFKARSVVQYKRGFHVGDTYPVRYDPYNPGAGCIIVGDVDLLEDREDGRYLLLAGGVAVGLLAIGRELYALHAHGNASAAGEDE